MKPPLHAPRLLTVALCLLLTTWLAAQPDEHDTFPHRTASATVRGYTHFTFDRLDTGYLFNIGAWLHGTEDFRWRVNRGKTESPGTGPKADRNNLSGHYLYVEASEHYPAETATLTSPPLVLDSFDSPAVSFWYHSQGEYAGKLCLEISDGGEWQPVWSIIGNQGFFWHKAVVDLSDYSGSRRLRFRAVTGADEAHGWQSDFAIDDVKFFDDRPDLLPEAVLSPLAGCMTSDEQPLRIALRNTGGQPVNATPPSRPIVTVTVRHQNRIIYTDTDTVKTPLAPFESHIITLPKPFSAPYIGDYTITVKVVHADGHTNPLTVKRSRAFYATNLPYYEDFEQANCRWTTDSAGSWLRTDRGIGDMMPFPLPDISNGQFMITGQSAGIRKQHTDLNSPAFDLTMHKHARLRFDALLLNPLKGMQAAVYVSSDQLQGRRLMKVVQPAPGWQTLEADLSDFYGHTGVRLHFSYRDLGRRAAGWAIDNIRVFAGQPAAVDVRLIDLAGDSCAAIDTLTLTLGLKLTDHTPDDLPAGTRLTIHTQLGAGSTQQSEIVLSEPLSSEPYELIIPHKLYSKQPDAPLAVSVCYAGDTSTRNNTFFRRVQNRTAPSTAFTIENVGGQAYRFTPDELKADSYLWTFNDGTGTTETSKITEYLFHESGRYEIGLTIEKDGCRSDTTLPLEVAYSSLPKDAAGSPTFTVAPNPTAGTTAVRYSPTTTAPSTLRLITADGRILFSRTFTDEMCYTLPTADLNHGLYIVRIITPDGTHTERLIKR